MGCWESRSEFKIPNKSNHRRGERQKQIPLREKEREGEREKEEGSEKKQIFVSLAFAWTSENPLNRTASLEDRICEKEIRARVK